MNIFKAGLIILFLSGGFCALAQKSISEATLEYNISIETGSTEPKMADMLDGATTTIYIKGSQSRSEMLSSLGSEATIHDAKTGNGVILKDYSGQNLSSEQYWH